MNDDTVKLIRVPADTWRVVVEALEAGLKMIEEVPLMGTAADYDFVPFAALELARKVKP